MENHKRLKPEFQRPKMRNYKFADVILYLLNKDWKIEKSLI